MKYHLRIGRMTLTCGLLSRGNVPGVISHASPYTSNDLLNYKSLDCYVNFISGFVREVFIVIKT